MHAIQFMPHGHCYLWEPAVLWMQVVSNGLIGLSYVAIASTLALLVRRVRDLPFKPMYLAFGVFIVACGFTHFMDVLVIWQPRYWLDGGVRIVTAVASVGTALMLPPLVPRVMALARGVQAAQDRGIAMESVARDLGTLYERTRELETAKSRFFANLSHELRTPLTLIVAPAERLLAEGKLETPDQRDLQLILKNANVLLRQVNDLLDIAKLEAGRLELHSERLDLADLLRLTTSQFETIARDRRIVYRVTSPESLLVDGDRAKIERVLLNLITNAFKFTPPGGTIRCALKSSEAWVRLEIADSGPGVPAPHRAEVFERFRQLPAGVASKFGGTGLGLSIVKEFTELHGGKVSIDQAPEGGALLQVLLPMTSRTSTGLVADGSVPASPSDATANAVRELQETVPEPMPAGQGPSCVLVVEDNADMSRFLAETLSRDHRVATARNGAEGLRVAQQIKPDLILTDLMMPEVGGDALIREIRADEALHDTPVVVLSAKADDALRLQLLREGVQDYVMKPFSAEEVRARVHNLVALKRTRDLLRSELSSREADVEQLAEMAVLRQRELRTALDSLRVARDQALLSSKVKTDFLNMVSHELRTPLTGLRLTLDRLRKDANASLGEHERKGLQKLDTSCRRLESLVRSLLDYTRIQAGRLSVSSEPTDLERVVQEALEEVLPQAEQKGLQLRAESASVMSLLETDPRLVRLIVVNLLTNAVKFTPQGQVAVQLAMEGSVASLTVTDTGPGIPSHEQQRIFEPFEQVETVHRKHTPGVGLGLSIVRELARALGGEVRVKSELNHGSTFTVTLPPLPDKSILLRSTNRPV